MGRPPAPSPSTRRTTAPGRAHHGPSPAGGRKSLVAGLRSPRRRVARRGPLSTEVGSWGPDEHGTAQVGSEGLIEGERQVGGPPARVLATAELLWEAARRDVDRQAVRRALDAGADVDAAVERAAHNRVTALLWRALDAADRLDAAGDRRRALDDLYELQRF